MSDFQKLPLSLSTSAAVLKRVQQAIDITGKSLPATVAQVISSGIVTVNFEMFPGAPFTLPQVTLPVHGTEYIRVPFQVGMKGYVNSADYYLGGVSGLGGGTADFSQRGNLTTLVFCPLGNTAWSTTDIDPNLLCQYGPNGVRLMDAGRNCIMTLTATGITVTIGGTTVWTLSTSANASTVNLTTTADVKTGTLTSVNAHVHTGVTTGSSDTGGPTG